MERNTLVRWLDVWNRKLHMYVGLYFLLFIWLFAFSGLMLNHPQWEWTRFWEHRKEAVSTLALVPVEVKDDFARAEAIAETLGLVGEIEAVRILPRENRFRFRVLRPGTLVDVLVDVETWQAEVKKTETNVWGVMHFLHQFNGVRMDGEKEQRDWVVTSLWTLAMDALCMGLIFLILSSLYMWYRLKTRQLLGGLVLGAGILCCGFFVFGFL